MPTPVGHALAGVAVGWLVEGRGWGRERATLRMAAAYAIVAALPDLDLLLPVHRGPSHGVGSAALMGLFAWAVTRRAAAGVAFAGAYGSHILLDWLGTDTTPPIGLMALWPLSREYYESSHHVFMAVSRRYWLPEFWIYNVRVLMRELLVLLPLILLAGILRDRRRRRAMMLLACGALCGATVADARSQESPRYADLLARYRAGDVEAAVKAVFSMTAAEMDERQLFERTPSGRLRDTEIQAAVMLHTEAHFDSPGALFAQLPAPHLDRAHRLVRRYLAESQQSDNLDEARQSERRDFVRRWFLLVVSQFQTVRHMGRSDDYLDEARALFPSDAEVLLASGSHHEMLTVGSGRVLFFDARDREVRTRKVHASAELASAASFFRAALAASPDLHEAQLRLGRVLHQRGELDPAARELGAVLQRAPQIEFSYLAAVFLALVEEERGSPKRAHDLYRRASRIFPAAQAPHIGMSYILYAGGESIDAANAVTRLLLEPAERDPWWPYIEGSAWHLSARLATLRVRVRQ